MTQLKPTLLHFTNKSHGSRYPTSNFQIRNPIDFFPPDDTNLNTVTSCSAGDPLDVTRSTIDRDIARLEESIRALKSRRNELSPISRLPAEILCEIFFLSILSGSSQRPEFWTNFSKVSQHWRSLALCAPELWTIMPDEYPQWAQEMLIRSKSAKLTIRSDPISNVSPETIRSWLYEMNRVEEITLLLSVRKLEKIFRGFTQVCASTSYIVYSFAQPNCIFDP